MSDDPPKPSALELADALLSAASHGTILERPVSDWLNTLRQVQDTGGHSLHGSFRNPDESAPPDPTLTATVGLRLLVVRIAFAASLAPEQISQADEILADLENRVRRSLARTRRYSPSRTLGDLACAWLIAESQNRGDMERLQEALSDATEYCNVRRWGNGEHLGEPTANRCLDALSVLLILARNLPDDLQTRCRTLLKALLEIDDAYGALPRVPDLGVASEAPQRTRSYRTREPDSGNGGALASYLRQSNWPDIVGSPAPHSDELEVRCFGNVMARAHFESDVRLGSMERFPLMPSSETRASGLSWHSYPVLFRRTEGDRGYFQWETLEGDTVVRHPDASPGALTSAVDPPIFGRTFAIQKGSDVIVLRILPAISRTWEYAIDRFRVRECHAEPVEADNDSYWRLQLPYRERTIEVSRFEFPGTPPPRLSKDESGDVLWDLQYDRESLNGRRLVIHLWAVTLARGSAWPAAIVPCLDSDIPRAPEQTAYDFRWKSAARNWHLLIDPLKNRPLIEL